jgi:sugar phosphate isomerase/epimerase
MAATLGASVVVTPAGGPRRAGSGIPEARAHDWFEQGIRRIIPLAEEFGVTVLVETGPGMLIDDNRRLRHFLRRVEHPFVRASLEVGHAFCRQEDPAAVVGELGPLLRLVHAEDVPPTREHIHLVPGRGAVDFVALGGALRDQLYRGFVSVDLAQYEETPEAAAAEARDALRSFLPG